MTIIVYLLKTTIVFVTLFSLYNIFLKNVTYLRLRRWYLNSIVVFSFVIPWLSPLLLSHYQHPESSSFLSRIDDAIRYFVATSWLTEPWGNDLVNTLIVTVLGVVFVWVTVKYIFSLTRLFRFLSNSSVISKNENYILRTGNQGEGCFCFLKTIYLHSPSLNEQNINVILEHEKAHIHQRHYIDLWLSALCDYFIWLYPFVRRFQKALNEVLECLADREAISILQIEPITYQSVLYSNMEYSGLQPVFRNSFGGSMIAQRILFISQKSNPKKVLFRLIYPIIAIGILVAGSALVDVQVFQLSKISNIRGAGYELNEVTTGYVLDSKTKDPVNNAIIESGNDVTVTDADGFFFIEKSNFPVNVQHIAYNNKNATMSESLIILIEPSVHTITEHSQSSKDHFASRHKKMVVASFKDYNDYISNNIRYSEKTLIDKITGTVWVSAEIGITGKVQKVQLKQGINADLDQEAIRLVRNMPKWNPALQNNVRTPIQVLLPVRF